MSYWTWRISLVNERIQELAEQAKQRVPAGLVVDKWIEAYNQIFAELIVRECTDVINKRIGPKSALNVLEHFGIKE